MGLFGREVLQEQPGCEVAIKAAIGPRERPVDHLGAVKVDHFVRLGIMGQSDEGVGFLAERGDPDEIVPAGDARDGDAQGGPHLALTIVIQNQTKELIQVFPRRDLSLGEI